MFGVAGGDIAGLGLLGSAAFSTHELHLETSSKIRFVRAWEV